jgi:hypothetical protein
MREPLTPYRSSRTVTRPPLRGTATDAPRQAARPSQNRSDRAGGVRALMRKLLPGLLALGLLSIFWSPTVFAICAPSTITVTSYADSGTGTLRQALLDSSPCNGTINIPAPGTNGILPGATIALSTAGDYTYGPSALPIPAGQTVTINALGNGVVIQRDTTVANLRLFYVAPTGNLTLVNVTLQGGKAQGGAGGDQSQNTQGSGGGAAAGLGGAIFNEGALTLNGVTLSGNTAQGGAGGATNGGGLAGGGGGGLGGDGGYGIHAGGGGGGNQGNGGAGLYCNGQPSGSGGATTGGDGGPPCSGQNGLSGGKGGGGGGGAEGGTGGTGNGGKGGFGAGGGGGAGARGGAGSGGLGGFGGGGGGGTSGIALGGYGGGDGGNCGSNLGGGFCGGNGGGGAGLGGAVFNNLGTLSITNSTLTGNSANGGGATSAPSTGQVSPVGGSGFGGAIFNRSGAVTTDNVTIAGNTVGGATGAGGGIYNYQDPNIVANATFSLSNSLLASTTGGTNCTNDGGTLSDVSHNLDDGASCGFSLSNASPNLQPLANNGGPTLTMALGAGSQAINAGDSSVCSSAPVNGIDQRGFSRRSGFCDIGAYEAQPANLSVYSGSPQSATVNTQFALPLKTLVTDGSSDPLGGVMVTYTPPSQSGPSATLSSSTATTDSSGLASVTATANVHQGSYNVVASVSGVASSVNFQLTNTPPRPPGISKAFNGTTMGLRGTTSLKFTLTNSNPSITLHGVGFSDNLPSGLIVATPNGKTGSSCGGTITATAGSHSIKLAGGVILANSSCTFSVNVFATTLGTKNNVTSHVTSTEGGQGGTASATITVVRVGH